MADTPTVIQPTASEAGIFLDGRFQIQWTPYSGGGNLTEVEVIIYASDGVTVIWRSLLRAPEAGVCGDGWMDTYPADMGLAAAKTYKVGVCVRDNVPSTSSISALVAFTTEAARVSAATWRGAQ